MRLRGVAYPLKVLMIYEVKLLYPFPKKFNINVCDAISRVLLRVRLLFYLKQEVIGAEAEKVIQGCGVQ